MKLEKIEVEWTRTEDEILKAGIMKYGINKWSKVSSLLPSKTPSQCKSRWQEYVNPLLGDSSWSADEDERLVETAKMFHPQWSLIGQIIGRSGQQCYERYNEVMFGKINVYKYGELEKPSKGNKEEEIEILEMAKARITNYKNRKDIKREKEKALRQKKMKRACNQLKEDKPKG